jgi:ribosomal protein L24E
MFKWKCSNFCYLLFLKNAKNPNFSQDTNDPLGLTCNFYCLRIIYKGKGVYYVHR